MHLLSFEKISFSMEICCKHLEHSIVFPVGLFWSNLHLMFLPIPSNWNFQVWSFFSSMTKQPFSFCSFWTLLIFNAYFPQECLVQTCVTFLWTICPNRLIRCIRNNPLICFSKNTTLRFLIFQVLRMLLLFQYCTSHILINIIIRNSM